GPPDHNEALPPGLMHPSRIREGVHAGVQDGGNQSGIPYSRGFELFDTRYLGKPLVYCGTVAVMPVESAGKPTHEKRTQVGDRVVMLGGRIGKDGIHGATFSSVELDEDSPVQAVQIGDPITQKMMYDFLLEALGLGLFTGITDNGAGGLSSSVGEMAEATGGAHIDLARAPLKYPGLAAWEILISEAQERMTVAVAPANLEAFLALAKAREVEASDLGVFTDNGRFVVDYDGETVVDLTLEFLHNGVPLGELVATWSPPARECVAAPQLAQASTWEQVEADILGLMGCHNLASHELLARHYDHEVKGLSVIKPLVGVGRDIPSTATVMRARHHRHEGVVLAEGIHPHYSDLDTYQMATAAVDEAVRRVLCAGARLDRLSALDNFCWPDPIVSAKNPDGAHKLAQLVRACEGLRDACETYGAPLISGKDSMKNDAYLGGVKISIPPTLLISVMGQMEDVRRALDLAPVCVGDDIYVLGETRDERGGSQWARLRGLTVDSVPVTELVPCMSMYRRFVQVRDAGLVRSAHAPGRGGLAVALAHMAMASGFRLAIDVEGEGLSPGAWLFSESTGRVVLTAPAQAREQLASGLRGQPLTRIGEVVAGAGGLVLRAPGQTAIELANVALSQQFHA
ncbi:MAG: AIR synthase-related protein, partial [Nannocystaceae bacterium]